MNEDKRPMFEINRISRSTSVHHIEYHPRLDSTNRLATDLLPDLLPLSPALVLTSEQSAGRGRGSNQWWASAGALTFSLVIDSANIGLPPERQPLISLAMGLAVRSALYSRLAKRNVSIKWPNDVLIDEQKACGILTERHTVNDRQALVVGVGINVNNSLANAPADVRQRATSLFDLSGESTSLDELLIDILNAFDLRTAHLSAGSSELISEINQHSLLNDRSVVLIAGNVQHAGRCQGIDANGGIQLLTANGPMSFISGSIEKWE